MLGGIYSNNPRSFFDCLATRRKPRRGRAFNHGAEGLDDLS
jgi:hypothetical protein